MSGARKGPRAAIVVVDRPGPGPVVGGMSVLERVLRTLGRTGVERCYLVGSGAGEALRMAAGSRPGCEVLPGLPDGAAGSAPHIVLGSRTLLGPALLAVLAERARVVQGPVVASGGGAVVGIVPAELLPRLAAAWAGVGGGEERVGAALARLAVPVPLAELGDGKEAGLLRRVEPDSVASAESALLAGLENPRDGLVDRFLNRRLSRPLTRLLLRVPFLGPNAVTLAAVAVGLAGAALVARGGRWWPLAGLAIIHLSTILDCSDGELARVRFRESSLGDWLDIGGDALVNLALFVAIARAVAVEGGGGRVGLLGAGLAAAAVTSFVLVTYAENTEEARRAAGGWENALIDRVLLSLTTRDYQVLVVIAALAGRLDWFLWGAALGAPLFCLLLLALLVRGARAARAA